MSIIVAIVLYASPLLVRVALTHTYPEWWRVAASLSPLVVVAPSMWLPRVVRNEEREHIARHATYALAFCLSAGASVRWDVVGPAASRADPWAVSLVAYLVLGGVSLWWFALSHWIENRGSALYTHHGDVAVLPLTLVAIGTFAHDVPDAAFQFSRCVVFYVPVVVAWATLHFVAFTGFATSCTTTHTHPHFDFSALSGLVIAATHLSLLEMRAPPLPFLFFPLVAAMLCQVTPRAAPALRPSHVVGMWAVALPLAGAVGALLDAGLHAGVRAVWTPIALSALAVLAVPRLAGDRWSAPASLYAALLTGAFLWADGTTIARAPGVLDAAVLVAAYVFVFVATNVVAAPADTAPPSAPPRQLHTRGCLGRAIRALETVRLPWSARRIVGPELVSEMLATRHPTCPDALAGVWWMCGLGFAASLVTVHAHRWTRDDQDRWRATFSLRPHTVRSHTLGGAINRLVQTTFVSTVTWSPAAEWTRTRVGVLPVLRWFEASYWLYAVDADEFARVATGEHTAGGVWGYRMLRVARADGTRTRHYPAMMAQLGGKPCLLG